MLLLLLLLLRGLATVHRRKVRREPPATWRLLRLWLRHVRSKSASIPLLRGLRRKVPKVRRERGRLLLLLLLLRSHLMLLRHLLSHLLSHLMLLCLRLLHLLLLW
jgi:hypothetical protein